MNHMPIITMEEMIFHVGQMDKSLKQKGSLEGSGLSFSTEPKAWVRINPFTGGKLFELKKEGNQFLDYYSLTEEQQQEIIQWGIHEGYVTACPLYRVTYYDDEMDMDLCSLYSDKGIGEEEAEDYGVELEEEEGFVSTEKMERRVMSHGSLLAPLDLLTTIYVEDELSIDGVWWEEELDISRYSAPRGVIVESKVKEWEVILVDEHCY
ncbi:hypothetical protein CVD28_04160 [Bacillus sp. M6-12]|uniref:hypothetical protein n=1 Tax=Bacillus sp. M6-12 TaxID=2054166 RepID=UPI000C766A1A|nr:hypothetical protein [Bacillus sp. M6-12]PLS19619.1 hypothetical protein CVD28_04160 [Bacillus sp. M6-12]